MTEPGGVGGFAFCCRRDAAEARRPGTHVFLFVCVRGHVYAGACLWGGPYVEGFALDLFC